MIAVYEHLEYCTNVDKPKITYLLKWDYQKIYHNFQTDEDSMDYLVEDMRGNLWYKNEKANDSTLYARTKR